MFTSDKQILKLPEILIEKGLVVNTADFFDRVGISKSAFSRVKNQEKYDRAYHFTSEQIERIGLIFNIDFNWIFGNSDEVFHPSNKQKVNKV